MQFPQSLGRTQLPLFDAFLAQPAVLFDEAPAPLPVDEPDTFSELTLRGAAGNRLHLLAPILRELSDNQDARWLTLIAPPDSLTLNWLRKIGLNRERILILQPRRGQTPLDLACEALRLGRSHTVVSWLQPLHAPARRLLAAAASEGNAQSLNISLT
ncbi:SOS-induced cell division inhibitor SulA [Zestomonas thermotolerans]|jgi:cell division inhibitor SulA|uniref:SOS-induced cell division inhibitor SulA n=1 Tax=Zestomonas thermotolerans TaxID=157784 RepID=UPI000480D220|nr:SOS-induced cell division inhibitor SulA [Pseudomonas thermotolerans]MBO2510000.1 CDP-glycerol--UDP-pyrophosphoryl-N-acetylglucosaminyl-N-acetylmannosamine glycerophosphotransferase [Gammaproteobacteria bacterium]